jgi:hypothetical protein
VSLDVCAWIFLCLSQLLPHVPSNETFLIDESCFLSRILGRFQQRSSYIPISSARAQVLKQPTFYMREYFSAWGASSNPSSSYLARSSLVELSV